MISGALAAVAVAALAGWVHPRLQRPRGRAPRPVRRRHARAQAVVAGERWAALLDTMAADVRGGASLTVAFTQATSRHGLHGHTLTPSLRLTDVPGATSPDPDETVVLQVVSAALALGGPVAATLDTGAALLRERSTARAEAHAHSAQARLSARVLTAVPLAFAGWSLLASPSFRTALTSTPGLVSAVIGGTLNLAGWWWMKHIVAKAAL